jgi:hypothetical protein
VTFKQHPPLCSCIQKHNCAHIEAVCRETGFCLPGKQKFAKNLGQLLKKARKPAVKRPGKKGWTRNESRDARKQPLVSVQIVEDLEHASSPGFPQGLPNSGAECWFNAACQCVAATVGSELELDSTVSGAVLQLVKALSGGLEPQKLAVLQQKAITEYTTVMHLDAARQNCSMEFLDWLLSHPVLSGYLKSTVSCLFCYSVTLHPCKLATNISTESYTLSCTYLFKHKALKNRDDDF